MDAVVQAIIMIDPASGVENAGFSHLGTDIDHGTGEHDRSGPDPSP